MESNQVSALLAAIFSSPPPETANRSLQFSQNSAAGAVVEGSSLVHCTYDAALWVWFVELKHLTMLLCGSDIMENGDLLLICFQAKPYAN
ncbi:hypothetical protein SDJN02_25558, partial [Cucurbita argyrosperma subsp. argyrosperma]